MNSRVVKLLTALTLGFLLNFATSVPASAQSAEKNNYQEIPRLMNEFPQHIQDSIILGTCTLIGLIVVGGIGLKGVQRFEEHNPKNHD